MSTSTQDSELKARHRAMWASGDYPTMVETFLLPLGPRLVEACAIGEGMRVLDVAAGTGNASLPAAERGAQVTASDLTPELLEAGRARAQAAGLELDWVEADAEHLPFDDGAFDVVMSSIGAMFAPHHADVARELARVCRPGGTIGLLSWTPEGMIGALFRTMGPFAPPPPSDSKDRLGEALSGHLGRQEARFDFLVQVQTDPVAMSDSAANPRPSRVMSKPPSCAAFNVNPRFPRSCWTPVFGLVVPSIPPCIVRLPPPERSML